MWIGMLAAFGLMTLVVLSFTAPAFRSWSLRAIRALATFPGLLFLLGLACGIWTVWRVLHRAPVLYEGIIDFRPLVLSILSAGLFVASAVASRR